MSQLLPTEPNCVTDCAGSMPIVEFTKCAPKTYTAQINYLYWTNVGQSMVDWTSPVEWAARLSNSSTNPQAIRTLFVIGSKPKPEAQKIKISLGREIIGKKKHTVAFKIDELNQTNHDMVRQIECGGQFLVWYGTTQLLWGGNSGIEASIDIDEIITDDSGTVITIEGTMSWEARFTPERIENPIA